MMLYRGVITSSLPICVINLCDVIQGSDDPPCLSMCDVIQGNHDPEPNVTSVAMYSPERTVFLGPCTCMDVTLGALPVSVQHLCPN